MEVGISGMIDDKFIRVKQSLLNHQREIKVIEKKLDNPQVPDGKKDKLIFRYFVIVNKVIPKITSSLNSYF